jgi:hypothetical protein
LHGRRYRLLDYSRTPTAKPGRVSRNRKPRSPTHRLNIWPNGRGTDDGLRGRGECPCRVRYECDVSTFRIPMGAAWLLQPDLTGTVPQWVYNKVCEDSGCRKVLGRGGRMCGPHPRVRNGRFAKILSELRANSGWPVGLTVSMPIGTAASRICLPLSTRQARDHSRKRCRQSLECRVISSIRCHLPGTRIAEEFPRQTRDPQPSLRTTGLACIVRSSAPSHGAERVIGGK